MNPKRYGYPEIKNGSTTYRERDLVMQLKNEEDVANGDVGEVLNIYKADGKSRMRVDFGGWKNHGIYRRGYMAVKSGLLYHRP